MLLPGVPHLTSTLFPSTGAHAATYTFAAHDAAKYVSESIDAHTAWINHVPYDMLCKSYSLSSFIPSSYTIGNLLLVLLTEVGPMIPLNSPLSLSTRYTPESFGVPRPQVVNRSGNTVLAKSLLEGKVPKSIRSAQEFLSPLPEIEQRPGHKIGFFEQGIITGGLITLTSLITIVSAAGYWALRMR
jgi:hypothetical protein